MQQAFHSEFAKAFDADICTKQALLDVEFNGAGLQLNSLCQEQTSVLRLPGGPQQGCQDSSTVTSVSVI